MKEAVARGFEMELERYGTPECYFLSLPLELKEKRDKVVKILADSGLSPIVPEGGYFILADVRELSKFVRMLILFHRYNGTFVCGGDLRITADSFGGMCRRGRLSKPR